MKPEESGMIKYLDLDIHCPCGYVWTEHIPDITKIKEINGAHCAMCGRVSKFVRPFVASKYTAKREEG